MLLNRSKSRLWGTTAAAVLAAFPLCSAFAQTSPAPVAMGGLMNPDDPSVILSNNLKILAQNPYNVDALLAAGTGSMAAGDPNAAIGFLARAEELSPRNGKVKAALGAALTQIERPVEALRIFADAVALGIPEIEIAGDRGLAWDLRGDQVRAQKDYALSLKRGRNDEVARRYALSLGISGEREDAMKLIDPLTKRGDQGAWRAKAFILAMNGDMNGADRILSAVMPANMIGVMSPFMRRLPSLSQAQRAQAVNFGTMPATGTSVAVVDPGDSFKSIGTGVNVGLAGVSPAAPVQVARVDLARPSESARDRKKREKQERELAKLAERGRQQAGVAPVRLPVGSAALPRPSVASAPVRLPPVKVATQTATRPAVQPSIAAPIVPAPRPPVMTAPTQSARPIIGTPPPLDQRVGRKIADVDPSRLPPEFRPNAGDSASKPVSETRVTVVEGARTLPLPDGVTPRPNIVQPAISGPVTVSTTGPIPATMPATMPAPRPVLTPVPAPIPVSLPAQEPVPVKAPEPVRVATVAGSAAVAPQGSALVPPQAGLSDVVVKVEPAKVEPIKVASALPAPSPAPLTTPSPAPTPATNIAPTPAAVTPPNASPPNASPVAAAPLASATPQGAGVTTSAVKLPDPVPGFSLPGASTPVDPASIPVPGNMPAVEPAVAAPTASDFTLPSTPPAIGVASSATPVVVQTEVALAPVNAAPIEPAPAAGLESVFEGLQVENQSTAGPIPTDEEFRARQLAAKRKADAAAKLAADEKAKLKLEADAKTKKETETKAKAALELEKEKEEAALAKANPARLWVQVATGANKSGLPITWRKLKTDAPKSLSGQSAWYVPFRATNRLLIGPFKSNSEARAMVGKLSKEGVSANSFSSEAGINIVRLGGR
jgi:SPOR domain